MGCKTSLLYDIEKNVWKKKGTDFDITMGAYDGGETCDICVLYLLSKLQHLNINIGAYKDDWLAVSSQSARCTERSRQELERHVLIFRGPETQLTSAAVLPARQHRAENCNSKEIFP